jgi:hypothetical protein
MYRITMTHAVTTEGKLVALRGAARGEAEAASAPKAVEAADYLMGSFVAANPGCGACATVKHPSGNEFDVCLVDGVVTHPETIGWQALLVADRNARSLLRSKRAA